MPRVCTICTHEERPAIDRALLAGEPFRNIAERFGTSTTGLHRHKTEHLGERMAVVAKRNEDADVRTAIDVVAQLRAINGAALRVLKDARDAGDGALTLQATDRILKQIELQAKLIDLINDGTTVNVMISPAWVQLRTAIVAVLRDHPDALRDVTAALAVVEGGQHARVA
jgi:hypothetical protein